METKEANPELMKPGEVAALFGVDPRTVSRWALSKGLTWVKTPGGHRRFFTKEILARYKEEVESQGGQ